MSIIDTPHADEISHTSPEIVAPVADDTEISRTKSRIEKYLPTLQLTDVQKQLILEGTLERLHATLNIVRDSEPEDVSDWDNQKGVEDWVTKLTSDEADPDPYVITPLKREALLYFCSTVIDSMQQLANDLSQTQKQRFMYAVEQDYFASSPNSATYVGLSGQLRLLAQAKVHLKQGGYCTALKMRSFITAHSNKVILSLINKFSICRRLLNLIL